MLACSIATKRSKVPEAEDLVAEHGFVLSADPSAEVERLNWGEIVRCGPPLPQTCDSISTTIATGAWCKQMVRQRSSRRTESPSSSSFPTVRFARIQYQVPAWALGAKITLMAFGARAAIRGGVCGTWATGPASGSRGGLSLLGKRCRLRLREVSRFTFAPQCPAPAAKARSSAASIAPCGGCVRWPGARR